MDVQASFAKLWGERFPGEIPPTVFHVPAETVNNNFDKRITSARGRFYADALNSFRQEAVTALLACEKTIEKLEKDLARANFLKDYLVNFLGSDKQAPSVVAANGLPEVNSVVLEHPGVNFPDPQEVKVGEVCTRVIRGKKSRVASPASSISNNEDNVYDNYKGPPLPAGRPPGKPAVPTPQTTASATTTTTVNNTSHSSRGVTKNKAAVYKCDSNLVEPSSYRENESDSVRAVVDVNDSNSHKAESSEADSSLQDKSTLTDPPPDIYNHPQPNPAVKTKPKPVPLPRPKRQRSQEDLYPSSGVVGRTTEELQTARGVGSEHTANLEQGPFTLPQAGYVNGKADLNSLLSAGNNRRSSCGGSAEQSASCVSSCGELGHDSPGLASGTHSEARQVDTGVVIEPSLPTPSIVRSRSTDNKIEVVEDSEQTSVKPDTVVLRDNTGVTPGVGFSGRPRSVLHLARKSISGKKVNVTEQQAETTTGTGGVGVGDSPPANMIRKLTHRLPSDSESVTGLKYRAKNNYEVVEISDRGPSSPLISSSSDCDSSVGSPVSDVKDLKEHHYENSMVHVQPLPDVVSGSGISGDGVSEKRLSLEHEDIDPKESETEEEESLYETLAVGKSFHAALTYEDDDSLSLNSDNDTVRSDASADSGLGSKVSTDGHHQPASPDLVSSMDTKEPFAALYATVNKLKRENSHEAAPLVFSSTDSETIAEATQPEQNARQRRSRVPDYEYVDIEDMLPDNSPPREPCEISSRNEDRRAVRHRHDYEECLPPGLGDQETVPPSEVVPARPIDGPPPVIARVSAPPPVRMRRDRPDGRPTHHAHNRDSQETIGSNRNSSPLPHDVLLDSSESDEEDRRLSSPEKEKLRLRKLVLRGILETERDYQATLEVLLQYMKSLEAAATSTQPVISLQDIKVIFSRIPDLYNIHMKFVHNLAERVNNWKPQQQVADLFKTLISSFPVYSEYMKNYPRAVEMITRCSEEKPMFRELAQEITVPNSKDTLSLQNMLFKPVVRIQRNTLVLHDLINCTPKGHVDYEELDKARRLSVLNLEEFGESTQDRSSRKIEQQQHLVKNSFMVEMMGDQRKLRYVFLFNDVIVCTKQKRSQRHNFEVKWFAPLTEILLTDHRIDQPGGDNNRESRISNMDEVEDLKKKVIALKTHLRKEIKKEKENANKEKSWSFASRSAAKAIEKQKKKLHELEAALVQASPSLPFKMYHKTSGKSYMFLMSTDYEREEWSEAIQVNQPKFKSDLVNKPLTPYDIQMLIENVKQLPKVNRVGNVLLRNSDDDGLNGVLNVTIHRLSGLTNPSDTFCCLELDSYGHFFMTARTNVCRGEQNPTWDEEFEVDLDGAQTLRILCYRRGKESEGDVLLGKSALELKTSWLEERFCEKEISLNEYSLMVSIRYVTAATTMKRLPSRLKTGVFGVKITTLVKREGRKIPTIVSACVDEIERRGMDETGIYRVSGVTSDVQRLKKAFDKNSRAAMNLLSEFDIHAVSGALKLYFRELPEPLFTEALYSNFIDSLALSDAEAKEKCMLSLLHSLPDPSLRTVLYLIDHLIRVSHHQNENKMNLNNLATIFGPTLLRPAAKDAGAPTPDMLFLGAQEALSQTAVLHYFIKLRDSGKDLNRPVMPKPQEKYID